MSRRMLALLVLSLAVGCDRRSDAVALDRDVATLRPAANRVGAILDSASGAAERGDTAGVHALLTDAEAAADEDPTLVYTLAAAADRLGDGANAAMQYAHYLTLAPGGPHAHDAATRRAALMFDAPPQTVTAAKRIASHGVARAACGSPRPRDRRGRSDPPRRACSAAAPGALGRREPGRLRGRHGGIGERRRHHGRR